MLSRNKHLVGLDIGSSVVKAVELRELKNGEYELGSLGMERLPSDAIVDGSIISKIPVADAINKIFKDKQIKNKKIATSLSGHSVIVKKVTVPLQTPEELDESIQWEAEQYIPFEISDVHIDYHILKENPAAGNMDIILVAVKKEKIGNPNDVLPRDRAAAVGCADQQTAPIPFAVLGGLGWGYGTGRREEMAPGSFRRKAGKSRGFPPAGQ